MFSIREYKELMKLLPQLSTEVVNLPSLLKAGTQSLSRATRSRNREQELKELQPLLDSNLKIQNSISDKSKLTESTTVRFMQLYFDQLSMARVHFDFRSPQFNSEGSTLIWAPSKISHAFEPYFLDGVKQLYNAFYGDNKGEFQSALSKLEIIKPDQSSRTQDELTKIFFEHFGDAQTGPVRLTLTKFQSSFQEIFSGFKKHGIKVSNDFAFLGAYLASMYSHMDEVNQEIDVRQAFVKSRISNL